MTGPSQGPGRNGGPNEDSGSEEHDLAKRESLLAHASSELVKFFRDSAKLSGLQILTSDEEQRFRERYIQAISAHVATELLEENTPKQDSIFYRLLGVAQDSVAQYALLALESIKHTIAYGIGMRGNLVGLTPGAHAGQLVRIPHSVPPENLAESFTGAADEYQRSTTHLFIAPKGLYLEARRFAEGDHHGLLGDLLASEVRALGCAPVRSWSISGGLTPDHDRSRFAFTCSSKEVGHLLLEVSVEEKSGRLAKSLSRPLGITRRRSIEPALRFRPAEGDPRSLDQSLARLGYTPVQLLDHPSHYEKSEPLRRDLLKVWQEWAPGYEWTLHLPRCYAKPDAGIDSFLVETQLIDSKGRYLVPSLRGAHSFASIEPISIVCEVKRDSNNPRGLTYLYEPRMIKLSSASPVEQLVVRSLESFPDSLLGASSLKAIRYVLNSDWVNWLDSDCGAHGYMLASGNPAHSTAIRPLTPLSSAPARFLCFHSRGAHTVAVRVAEDGLLDLRRGIYADHFFPELPPFQAIA